MTRNAQLTRLRARLRAHPALFGDCGAVKEAQCERLLRMTRDRLKSDWDARADVVAHRMGQRLLNTYA